MIVAIPAMFVEAHEKEFSSMGLPTKPQWKEKTVNVDLALTRQSVIGRLFTLIKESAKPKSALAVVARDIESWIKVLTIGGARPRNCQQLAAFLREEVRRIEGHRVFSREDGVLCCYYVGSITYFAPNQNRSAHVGVSLFWEELAESMMTTVHLDQRDMAKGGSAIEILGKKGYMPETEELRSEYIATRDRFLSIYDKVGMQFTATGRATDNLDGNPGKEDRSWEINTIQLDLNDREARVLIDVFHESEKSIAGEPTH